MVSKVVEIINPGGLHLRPAGNLCKEAIKYKSRITINFKGCSSNAKSVLGILAACVKFGDSIEIVCEGIDEEKALSAIVDLVEAGFNENE